MAGQLGGAGPFSSGTTVQFASRLLASIAIRGIQFVSWAVLAGFADNLPRFLLARQLRMDTQAAGAAKNNNQHRAYMNTLTIKGDWNITKGKLKQKYAQLTDNDLTYVSGQEDELVGRIQKRTGQTKEQIERLLSDCNCNH